MASTALVRVTGKVLALPQPRSGVSQTTGNTWEIATANILVANQNVTVVQLPPRSLAGFVRPQVDEVVDYLCEVSIYKTDVQTSVVSAFPEEFDVTSLQLQRELHAGV